LSESSIFHSFGGAIHYTAEIFKRDEYDTECTVYFFSWEGALTIGRKMLKIIHVPPAIEKTAIVSHHVPACLNYP